jgi:hypothetical protein
MLVPPKSIMQLSREFLPGSRLQMPLNQLPPARSRTIQMHRSHTIPQWTLDSVHVEIVLTTRLPELWIFTRKLGKLQFRQTPLTPMTRLKSGTKLRWSPRLLIHINSRGNRLGVRHTSVWNMRTRRQPTPTCGLRVGEENAEDIFCGYLWMRMFLRRAWDFLIDHDAWLSSKFLAARATRTPAEIFSAARTSDTIEVWFFVSVVLRNQYQ